MTRRNNPAKWVLPSTVNPTSRRCMMVPVPDDPQHIAAFRGALLSLASAYNWADDPSHTAKDVALVWRDIIDGLDTWGCGDTMLIRECTSACGIEYSTDGGHTWTCIDLGGCIENIWDEKLAQAFDDGVLGRYGGQPSPAAPPIAGSCKSWHVVLAANGKWKIPSAVSGGDTIHVTGAKGGAADGALAWYCPDGKAYVIGECFGDVPYLSTDPLQAGNHMQIIGGYNTTTPVYFDPLTSSYTIEPGVINQEAWLQVNDSPIDDNAGSFEFDIEVCTGGWTHMFLFTDGALGWEPEGTGQALWTASGWIPQDFTYGGYAYRQMSIRSPIVSSSTLTRMRAYTQYTAGHKNGTSLDWWAYNQVPTLFNQVSGGLLADGVNTVPIWTGSLPFTRLFVHLNCSYQDWTGSGLLTALELSGIGTDPF